MNMMTPNTDGDSLVAELAQALMQRGWSMVTAESCTGGMIAARCTDRAGSSAWFERGFITYSNEAKQELLDVPEPSIAREGAVSATVAQAMAEGALRHSHAQVAVSVTGIAGPGGAVPGKPVGTVWMGWAVRDAGSGTQLLQLPGDRAAVRQATVMAALRKVIELAQA